MKRRGDLVGQIPDLVWAALTDEERGELLVIGDAASGRIGTGEMRDRLAFARHTAAWWKAFAAGDRELMAELTRQWEATGITYPKAS